MIRFSGQFETRQRYVQGRLFEGFGIRVDQVLQGFGTTNTGNLARKCLSDPTKFAEYLELDERLVTNISTVITAFRCKQNLELDKVQILCSETYRLYFELYPWARMSPTVHKILKHGVDIAKQFPMPMAFFSEDANETSHKYYRSNFKNHARQYKRSARLLDVFNRQMYRSDPKVSMMYIQQRLKKHKHEVLSENVKNLLQK